MGKIIVKKAKNLKGEITIHGSKNSALPILAASVLANNKTILKNIPDISDINNMVLLLSSLGFNVAKDSDFLTISPSNEILSDVNEDIAGKLRGSILLAGPMLAKFGKITISYPGGCSIGSRPIDLHLKGLEALGAKIEKKHGKITMNAKKLIGAKIYLDFPSVGATENLIMASAVAEGETCIENAATEPEIVDLCDYLTKMGAQIYGSGTETIKICGKKELHGTTHSIIPDRIEAGTYLIAVAAAKGEVTIKNIICDHLKPVILKLKEMGVEIEEYDNILKVKCDGKLKATDIKTLPYPGFPTDMQAPFSVLLSQVKGSSMITESIFENRFRHLDELKKMGALIKTDGRCAFIEGGKLSGAKVISTDLRSGAALVIAGLCAEGETEIDNYENILRGYKNLDKNLISVGADIKITD